MRKIYRLLIPAIVAIALFASCEDQMDEVIVNDGTTIENIDKTSVLPDKSKIKTPPR